MKLGELNLSKSSSIVVLRDTEVKRLLESGCFCVEEIANRTMEKRSTISSLALYCELCVGVLVLRSHVP